MDRISNLARKQIYCYSRLLLCVSLPLTYAIGVSAGTLDVLSSAAQSGSSGLRVGLGSSCAGANHVSITGQTYNSVSSEQACSTISASNSTVSSTGDTSLTGGYQVALGPGFRVNQGGVLQLRTDQSLVRGAFVSDGSPSNEKHYAVRFYFDVDGSALADNDQFHVFDAADQFGEIWFSLVIRYDGTANENRLFLEARDDAGGTLNSGEIALSPGWHWIELEWWAADASANNGRLTLNLDGTTQPSLQNLDNDTGAISLVRWGAMDVTATATGTLDLDDFDSRKAGIIGPAP